MSYYSPSLSYTQSLHTPPYQYHAHTHPIERYAGHYTVHSVIGVGTYGEVRVGVNTNTGQRVAIKIIDFSRFNDDTILLIRNEIKILKYLTGHNNIIRIIETCDNIVFDGEYCDNCACTEYRPAHNSTNELCQSCNHSKWEHTAIEQRNVLLIVQELCCGGEIFGLVSNCGQLSEELCRYLFQQLLSGLQYCHSHGVIHRDLKPENLVLDHTFQLKIVDFGLAALIDPSTTQQQPTLHSGVGSQPYSAPEVYYVKELYNNTPYNGSAADIWSCAVILYVMLTGRPPFLRPLDRTHNTHLRKCKHFISLMNGDNYYNISADAKSLLQSIFQLNANDRPTLQELQQHPWLHGPIPTQTEIVAQLEMRAKKVWLALEKPELVDCMRKMRQQISKPISTQTGLSPLFDRTGLQHLQSPIIQSSRNIFDADSDIEPEYNSTATTAAISIKKPTKLRQSHIPQSYYQLSTSTSSMTPTPVQQNSYMNSHNRLHSNVLQSQHSTHNSDVLERNSVFNMTPPHTSNITASESCSNVTAHTLNDISQLDKQQLHHHSNSSTMLPHNIMLPDNYTESAEKYAEDDAKTPLDTKDTHTDNIKEVNLSDVDDSDTDEHEIHDTTTILSLSRSFHALETPPRSISTHSTQTQHKTKTGSVSPIINAHHYKK